MVSVEEINALLPQTQCGQCGYNGCLPYAQALALGQADINQCPPGGEAGIRDLASLLNVVAKPLNPKHGVTKPAQVALIIEQTCIGCAKCLVACPVDAIVGAAKFMHTVISSECTGCELCVPPCPVDCIVMQPIVESKGVDRRAKALLAKRRYDARNLRKQQQALIKAEKAKAKKAAVVALHPRHHQ